MSLLSKTLETAVASVPECLAAGHIDLWQGILVDMHTIDSHPQEITDLLAAATADLFLGPNVSMIESLFKKSRGLKQDGTYYFEEIIVNSANLIHVFVRSQDEDHVTCFVCRRSANMGMVLSKIRNMVPSIEAAI
jgi:hypothetical protein